MVDLDEREACDEAVLTCLLSTEDFPSIFSGLQDFRPREVKSHMGSGLWTTMVLSCDILPAVSTQLFGLEAHRFCS